MRKRKQRRTALLVRLLALIALAVSGVLLWRWVVLPPTDVMQPPLPLAAATAAMPRSQAPQPGEDFSAAERQRLEDILRQKNRAAQ